MALLVTTTIGHILLRHVYICISIQYHTNALSLSETLETSMPILELKACSNQGKEMQLHAS
jgi:hypothetical protein